MLFSSTLYNEEYLKWQEAKLNMLKNEMGRTDESFLMYT